MGHNRIPSSSKSILETFLTGACNEQGQQNEDSFIGDTSVADEFWEKDLEMSKDDSVLFTPEYEPTSHDFSGPKIKQLKRATVPSLPLRLP